MLEILTRICQGEGQEGDIEKLVELGNKIKDTALCGLGQTAPNPVLSTIRHFRHEYEAHIRDKYCPSMVCKRISPAPCQRSCPVGVDVPSYNALTATGRFDEALDVIRQDNPFPGVCGRLCSRPCEASCTQRETDESVAIRSLKRVVADQEGRRWKAPVTPPETTRTEKIAVIGAGPAGLTAARDLRREGYPVTVFEAASEPGGMLRLAVPDFRLPAEVLDRDIQAILDAGVEIRTGVVVGRDVTIDGLRQQGYRAMVVATGAHKPLRARLAGLDGGKACLDALDFLKEVKLGRRPRLGSDAVVVGCTYAALDAARAAVRLGCPNVTLVYPRDRDQLPFEEAELKAAEEEGVTLCCLHQAVEVVRKGEKVTGLKCVRCEAQAADKAGRARGLPKADDPVLLPATAIIFALGQEPDLLVLSGGPDLERNAWNFLVTDPVSLATNAAGMFAAGEVVTGSATVIEAIAAGQRAAIMIDRFLRGVPYGESHKLAKPRRRIELAEGAEALENFKRPLEALRPSGERAHDFREADLTFSEMLAVCEARRCLRCDLD
jgi:NADH-quinone oxidoreductase subunit F